MKSRRGEERESLFGMEKRGKNPGSEELRKGCEGVTTWKELRRMGEVKGEVWKDLSREEIGWGRSSEMTELRWLGREVELCSEEW